MIYVDKHRLYLSNHSRYVIDSDSIAFLGKKSQPAFINKLIEKYYKYAECSSFIYNNDNKTRFDALFEINHSLKKLSTEERKTIYEHLFPKDDNQAYEFKHTQQGSRKPLWLTASAALMEIMDKEPHSSDIMNREYIETLIEEYTHKPFDEREKIFKRDTYEKIEDAIKKNQSFFLTVKDDEKEKIGNVVDKNDNKNSNENTKIRYHVLPYRIMQSSTTVYSYLVCLSAKVDKNDRLLDGETYKPAAFRVSRITPVAIDLVSSEHFLCKTACNKLKDANTDIKLPQKRKNDLSTIVGIKIDQALGERDVEFLSYDHYEIKIRLTKKGIEQYNRLLHLRPKYIKKEQPDDDGSVVYVFHSCRRQIEAYFFSFGADAEIMSPLNLRKKFKKHYITSSELYSK